ncbi:unnamed protein product [Diamesa serratosioi]
MDINRVTNEKKLNLCRWYFRVGFAFLPFVWLINTVWFFGEAFKKPVYEEQVAIKRYVIFSAIGLIVWMVVLGTWITLYQLNRVEWGEFADNLSFIIPLGSK